MPPISLFPDDALLGRYVAGRATAEEQAKVAAWLDENPHRSVIVEQVRRAWAVPPMDASGVSETDVERVWADVRKRTIDAATTSHTVRPALRGTQGPSGLAQWRRILFTAAAVVAVVLAVTHVHHSANSNVAESGVEHIHGPVFRTAAGQRATFTLPDGSTVILAPQTTLTVSNTFQHGTRTVALVGQAYFDVKTAPQHPFVVQCGAVRTRVLGTRFSVLHYADDHGVQVAVTSGKVAVAATTTRHPSVILTAGTVGHVTDSTATASTAANIDPYIGWTQGRLQFYNAPVSDVLRAVGRWYGYEFRVTDSTIATLRVTTTLDGLTAAEALNAIKRLLPATMTFNGHIISVHAVRPSRATTRTRDLLSTPREVGR